MFVVSMDGMDNTEVANSIFQVPMHPYLSSLSQQ
jgi:hypothetical protein